MIALILRLLLNIIAAEEAATPHVSARLLLAVGYVESRYESSALSTPHGSNPPYYCAELQTTALSHWECERQQSDTFLAYRQGAREIEAWWRYYRGDLVRMLAGYGCGFASATCNGYPARVLRIERLLSTNKLMETM